MRGEPQARARWTATGDGNMGYATVPSVTQRCIVRTTTFVIVVPTNTPHILWILMVGEFVRLAKPLVRQAIYRDNVHVTYRSCYTKASIKQC